MKYLPLLWGGLWRRPGRAILTLLSIVNAFLLFSLLEGFVSGLNGAKSQAHAEVLFTASRVSNVVTLPVSLAERFDELDGVTAVSPVAIFLGYYQNPAQAVRAFAFDPDQVPQVTPAMEVSPEAVQAFRKRPSAVLVSQELMQHYGWKVGDQLPLISTLWANKDGSRAWTFHIVGVFSSDTSVLLRDSILLSFDYLDRTRTKGEGAANVFVVRVNDADRIDEIAAEIDRLTQNSPYETRTQTEAQGARNTLQSIGNVGLMVNSVVGAVFFTLLLSVGSQMNQSFRERTQELGVLKALGFSDVHVLLLVLGEAVLTCGVAAVVGLLLGQALYPFATTLTGVSSIPPSPVLLPGLGLAALLALVSGLPPAWRALRIPVADALADR